MADTQDQSFLTQTSQDNLAELIGGTLAQENSGSLAVSIYGRQLVTDHDFATVQTDLAALQSSGTVSASLDPTQLSEIAKLASLKGTSFDQEFLSNEAQTNAQSVAQTQQEIASGQDPAVTQLAAVLLPYQQAHLTEATLLQSSIFTPNGPASPTPALPLAANGPVNSQDQTFIDQATASNLDEIGTGQLVLQQTSNSAVQEFAGWMVTDHTAANATLASLAEAAGVTPPTTSDALNASLAALQGQTGSAFDQQYIIGNSIESHVATIALFDQEALYGSDPALVAFAQAQLPTLEQHLAGALQIGGALAAGLNDASAAPSTAAGQAIKVAADTTAMSLADLAKTIATSGDTGLLADVTGSVTSLLSGSGTGGSSGILATVQQNYASALSVFEGGQSSGSLASLVSALQQPTA